MASEWAKSTAAVAKAVQTQSQANLNAYAANPALVREQFNIELATAEGGYQHRQLYELVQNAADAMLADPGGRIEVILTSDALYCANEGEPFDEEGATAILQAFHSPKRGSEIGRFGLGFKSVLGITDSPQVFSRTASFGFDRSASEMRIREVVPGAASTPVLRVAELLDASESFRKDAILMELGTWASTIVKAPLLPVAVSRMSSDMALFPREFVLFSASVGRFVLDDRTKSHRREISLERSDGSLLLRDGEASTRWHLLRTKVRPSGDARADAGEIIFRDEVPLEWAVSYDRRAIGEFWAFFPTEFRTTLSGILNAPWKTNSDRQNLLRGEFNDELIEEMAKLVVGSLPELVIPEDPGRFLEFLPGRGREARNWADEMLGDRVMELAKLSPSLPDQNGELKRPAKLKFHPDVSPDAIEAWAQSPSRPVDWVHTSVVSRERRARAERLLEGRRIASITEWLEALGRSTPAASAAAIAVAARLIQSESLTGAQSTAVGTTQIVLTASGVAVAPDASKLFLDGMGRDAIETVHPDLLGIEGCRSDLAVLGIGELDVEAEFRALLGHSYSPEMDWDRFWRTSRMLESERLGAILLEQSSVARRRIRVRNVAGEYERIEAVLLPGVIATSDRDPRACVDVVYHADDLAVLESIGATEAPRLDGGTVEEAWFTAYKGEGIEKYEQELERHPGQNPSRELIDFVETRFLGPLQPFELLSGESKARFTEAVMAHPDQFGSWHLAHSTRPGSYPNLPFPSPVLWLIFNHGLLTTSQGIRLAREAVGPGLDRYFEVLPVAQVPIEIARRLRLPAELSEIKPARWKRMLASVAKLEYSRLGAFYELACERIGAPDRIACVVGGGVEERSPDEVTVVEDPLIFEMMREMGTPVVQVSSQGADLLVEKWGLREDNGDYGVGLEFEPSSAEIDLLDEFRPLKHLVAPDVTDLRLVRCSNLRRVTTTPTGSDSQAVQGALEDGTLYWSDQGDDRELLEFLDREVGLGLQPGDIEAVLHGVELDEVRVRADRIRSMSSVHERIAAMVTGDQLRRHLPRDVVDSLEQERAERLGDLELVELALAIHGVGILKELSSEITAAGFEPPRTWNGRAPARRWVQELGFPSEYAGSEPSRRDPLLRVDGAPTLKPLHGFQRHIAENIKDVVLGKVGNRGLVALPTGAGKTRTAVQALTEMIRDGELGGVVLWVAQSDELCEQAVQAWAEVWRSEGPSATLSISRLWGDNGAEPAGGAQVVVATIAKLDSIQNSPERLERYEWLATPSCVIVDEAHISIAPTFTKLFEWLELDRKRRARPVVGLTATPFRGTSETETERLVRRYEGVRLDDGAFEGDPYQVLQEMGVLARVRHQVLDGGAIELTEDELVTLQRTRRLPPSVESRVAADEDRNRTLLTALGALDDEWTALVFAASVDHAKSLAARLALDGIPSAPVWGGTPPATRRVSVEKFRRGEIRVLTNYSVFAEGFDAPAVRAVFIARPTFSPNLYQQMVGRGMRGPLNGGKDECLIVDVADNVTRYGGELAFRDYERLWQPVPEDGRTR